MSDKPTSAAEVPGFNRLTPREQLFVQHPDVYRDPKKAALEVGYSSSTIEKRAHSMRQRLLRFIQPAFEARLAKVNVDRQKVEDELAAIAFTIEDEFRERVDIETPDGGYQSVVVWKDPMQLPEHMRRAIKFVEYGTETLADGTVVQSDRPVHVVLYSKEKALKELAGLFGDMAPKNPVDEQQQLFDHLSLQERETLVRLYSVAARRAAGTQSTEGTNGHKVPVQRIEAPSTPSPDRTRDRDEGGQSPGDEPADVRQPDSSRGVRRGQQPRSAAAAPRRARATPVVVLDQGADSDVGYRDLPD